MAQIQRPGAHILASEFEWSRQSRKVAADAIPIIILWPFGPIAFVYELSDTLPAIDRDSISDPFAVRGSLPTQAVDRLCTALRNQKSFVINVELAPFGHQLAGSAIGLGPAVGLAEPKSDSEQLSVSKYAGEAVSRAYESSSGKTAFRVKLNNRLSDAERFVTLAHELGHIFCGHLGAAQG